MNAPDPSDGYVMVFADGPLATSTNVETVGSKMVGLTGQPGNIVVKRDVFTWPLPDRLRILTHPGAPVAMWGEGEETTLPDAITESPNAVTYVKVRESQLPEDLSHVMRGAEYKLA